MARGTETAGGEGCRDAGGHTVTSGRMPHRRQHASAPGDRPAGAAPGQGARAACCKDPHQLSGLIQRNPAPEVRKGG